MLARSDAETRDALMLLWRCTLALHVGLLYERGMFTVPHAARTASRALDLN